MLILSASIGGGHVAAARALEAAFGREGDPCLVVDLLGVATEAAAAATGLVRVRPLGSTPDAPPWMAAAARLGRSHAEAEIVRGCRAMTREGIARA